MNIDPEILRGEPCFNGTRVLLEAVIDNLAVVIFTSLVATDRTH